MAHQTSLSVTTSCPLAMTVCSRRILSASRLSTRGQHRHQCAPGTMAEIEGRKKEVAGRGMSLPVRGRHISTSPSRLLVRPYGRFSSKIERFTSKERMVLARSVTAPRAIRPSKKVIVRCYLSRMQKNGHQELRLWKTAELLWQNNVPGQCRFQDGQT